MTFSSIKFVGIAWLRALILSKLSLILFHFKCVSELTQGYVWSSSYNRRWRLKIENPRNTVSLQISVGGLKSWLIFCYAVYFSSCLVMTCKNTGPVHFMFSLSLVVKRIPCDWSQLWCRGCWSRWRWIACSIWSCSWRFQDGLYH